MNISKIFVACYKGDVHLTRICVASIRYWYPKIEIFLIKDYLKGDFSTKYLEKYYNVKLFKSKIEDFGWGISKLEPFFIKKEQKVLIIDSDIIFTGKVLDELNKIDSDFILSGSEIQDINTDWVKRTYFNYQQLSKFDNTFDKPDFLFNTGQLVICTNKLARNDFSDFIDYNSRPPKLLNSDFISCADQGILNYVLHKKNSEEILRIFNYKFHTWPCNGGADFIKLENIINKTGYPFLIHWAGCVKKDLSLMKRYDLLSFFEQKYFKSIPFGKIRHTFIIFQRRLYSLLFNLKQKCKDLL